MLGVPSKPQKLPKSPLMHSSDPASLSPGSVIGILGGGQLGRMTALAAARLGYGCHVVAPEAGSPTALVAGTETVSPYEDFTALARFADSIDVATFEFENLPVESIEFLEKRVPVHPGLKSLAVAQDRLVEKKFLRSIDIPIAPFSEVNNAEMLIKALAELGTPAVLKTARLGYDGKGQVLISKDTNLDDAYRTMGALRGVLEKWIDFKMEISVIIARRTNGKSAIFDPTENQHQNHILDTSISPARISKTLTDKAKVIAEQIAAALNIVGLLAVEMFVTQDDGLLVNEIAPRPHNSGHWTQDGCATSQFELFVRAICGQPLGSTERRFDTIMTNLIGDQINSWPAVLKEANSHLHLYGKSEARKGRKMGHVNRIYPLGHLAIDATEQSPNTRKALEK